MIVATPPRTATSGTADVLDHPPAQVLALDAACNDRCSFCPVRDAPLEVDGDAAAWRARLQTLYRSGVRRVLVRGGEPTLSPELPRVLRVAGRVGMRLTLCTNGRRLGHGPYAEHLLATGGLEAARVRWFGPGPLRALVGGAADADEARVAHEQVSSGVARLAAHGVPWAAVLTITSPSDGPLPTVGLWMDAARSALAAGASRVVVCCPEPTAAEAGRARPLGQMAQVAAELLAGLPAEVGRAEGWPRCLVATSKAVPAPRAAWMKPPECGGCTWRVACPGVAAGDLAEGSTVELAPRLDAPPEARAPVTDGAFFGVPIATDRTVEVPEEARVDIAPRYPDTLLMTLIVGVCDLSCRFCDVPQGDSPPAVSTLDAVTAALEAMRHRTRGVFFTGGEASGVPWLVEAFERARALGYERIQLQTHAGRASDPAVADRWLEAGLTAVDVPLYGANAALHEKVTRTPGSFDRTLAGFEALKARGLSTVVHTTVFGDTLSHVPGVLGLVERLAPDAAYLQITGALGPPETYGALAPAPGVAGPALERAFADAAPKVPWTVAELAACHAPSLADRIASSHAPAADPAWPVVMPFGEWLMTFSGGRTRRRGARCETCTRRTRCDGLPTEAFAAFGEECVDPERAPKT